MLDDIFDTFADEGNDDSVVVNDAKHVKLKGASHDDTEWLIAQGMDAAEVLHAVHGLHLHPTNPFAVMQVLSMIDNGYFSEKRRPDMASYYMDHFVDTLFS